MFKAQKIKQNKIKAGSKDLSIFVPSLGYSLYLRFVEPYRTRLGTTFLGGEIWFVL
jgi:hypothetical protein